MVDLINEKEYSKLYNATVIPYINARKISGYFSGVNNAKLCYSFYKADNERGTVVIVHGLGEGMPKYQELIYYFLNDGLSVYIYDQRGHGLSTREVADTVLIHVSDFNFYVLDLEIFINTIVEDNSKPLYLFGHSMGGGISALYLETCTDNKIKKAFLSSPMLEIKSPKIPKFVIRSILFIASTFACKKKLFYVKKHPYYKEFENSSYTSIDRYNEYENFRQKSVHYHTCTATNKWGYSAFKATKSINTTKNINKIKTPIFIATAELEKLVNNSVHKEFANALKVATNKI